MPHNFNLTIEKKVFKKRNGKVLLDNWVRETINDKGMSIKGNYNNKRINMTRKFRKNRNRRRQNKTKRSI